MQIHVARTLEDVEDVEEIMESDTWSHAREFLGAAATDPFADHLRWLEKGGRSVACVQVFLHRYPIGCALIGMCLPEYPFVPPEFRGRGYFKRLMADLFEWMRGAGYPLAYAHGRKGLYTGIGFAPCFHHCLVLIRVEDAVKVNAQTRAVPATEADIASHVSLFREPFPLGRGLQCRDENWRPDPKCVRLVWSEGKKAVDGFLVGAEVLVRPGFADFKAPMAGEILTITDACAKDISAAAALLKTVADEAHAMGFEWIRINCPRGDAMARIAVLAGGELRWCAGQERDYTDDGEDVDAFYLADLRLALEQLLRELNARWKGFTGDAPPAMTLGMDAEEVTLSLGQKVRILEGKPADAPIVCLPRKAMTRAIMGYATPSELSLLHEGCEIPEECRAAADALFVAREPHLIHENWAFARPEQFGLVP